MLLGKRPRPPIRRTTSMTGITVDLPEPSHDHQHHHQNHLHLDDDNNNNKNYQQQEEDESLSYYDSNSTNITTMMSSSDGDYFNGGIDYNNSNYGLYEYDQRFLAATMLSPRNHFPRRNSADFLVTAHFLRTCGLCQRRLAPGKDIYMYRGDSAFCSLECREKQMKLDERKEKCSSSTVVKGSNKEDIHASSSTTKPTSKSSSSSRKSETVAAA